MSGEVVSLHGGPTGLPTPNEDVIKTLERWLEKARSGEIVGVVGALLHHDSCAAYGTAGLCASYSMVGALAIAQRQIVNAVEDGAE